jgi:hypothetical protein
MPKPRPSCLPLHTTSLQKLWKNSRAMLVKWLLIQYNIKGTVKKITRERITYSNIKQ